MRDLGSDVVRDVRLANPVQDVGTDRAEEVTVDGAERAAGERPFACAVVREVGIRVLEVGDLCAG